MSLVTTIPILNTIVPTSTPTQKEHFPSTKQPRLQGGCLENNNTTANPLALHDLTFSFLIISVCTLFLFQLLKTENVVIFIHKLI